jgi:ATP-dependent Clp protease ATP-binding subunit ClpC
MLGAMYPFERFSDAAKKALTLAQEEAERSHHSYIGTEHILIALLREPQTIACQALSQLGVQLEPARAAIESVLDRNQHVLLSQHIIPTARVKRIIEIAFEDARRAGDSHVGTEHLLIGLLEEGQGVGAHVLYDLGVTLDKARAAISAAKSAGVVESVTSLSTEQPASDRLMARLWPLARQEADADVAGEVEEAHVLRALLKLSGRLTELLSSCGLDVAGMLERLRPPERVVDLRRSLRSATQKKDAAVRREDYAAAEQARQLESDLQSQLADAEREWKESNGKAE